MTEHEKALTRTQDLLAVVHQALSNQTLIDDCDLLGVKFDLETLVGRVENMNFIARINAHKAIKSQKGVH